MTASDAQLAPQAQPERDKPTLQVFVKGYETKAAIGVWDFEKGTTQPLRFTINLNVTPDADGCSPDGEVDNYEYVICYQSVVETIESILSEGHIELVETLGARLIETLRADARIIKISLEIEKLAAIEQAQSVGVRFTYIRP